MSRKKPRIVPAPEFFGTDPLGQTYKTLADLKLLRLAKELGVRPLKLPHLPTLPPEVPSDALTDFAIMCGYQREVIRWLEQYLDNALEVLRVSEESRFAIIQSYALHLLGVQREGQPHDPAEDRQLIANVCRARDRLKSDGKRDGVQSACRQLFGDDDAAAWRSAYNRALKRNPDIQKQVGRTRGGSDYDAFLQTHPPRPKI